VAVAEVDRQVVLDRCDDALLGLRLGLGLVALQHEERTGPATAQHNEGDHDEQQFLRLLGRLSRALLVAHRNSSSSPQSWVAVVVV
jgi:hypothetical protein